MLTLAANERELFKQDLVTLASASKHHGSPRQGESLAAATETRGKPVREAVTIIAKSFFQKNLNHTFSQIFSVTPQFTCDLGSLSLRAAWNLVLIWLTARSSGECLAHCKFQEAENWFRRDLQPTPCLSTLIPIESLCDAEQLLNGIQFDSEFQALIPYILEEHGPGSRASVLKDPTTATSRAAKRENGVFYTPADVADYMVKHVRELYDGNFLTAQSLDPACGTGVFFLAMLRAAISQHGNANSFSRLGYITSCLYGLDVSGQALDAAAFVLLQECLSEISAHNLSPLDTWKSIRHNLVEADALRIDFKSTATEFFENPFLHLTQIFPRVSNGFDILVGNPPYAAIGDRKDIDSLALRFASLNGGKISQRANLYSLFVEMMWRFTKPACNAAALVTPLSIAFHGGAQYENCRQAMSWNGGRWQFAFFDREPHALFGEEVKTRNAILFRFESKNTPERGEAANIETGPLRKWTSRTRSSLFQSVNFTAVDSVAITAGIPKLGGSSQAEAFITLKRRLDRFPSLTLRIGTCALAKALNGEKLPKIFIGGTAYNFLNVYRPTHLLPDEHNIPLSESPVHSLEFKTERLARIAFAILSSRLIFWLWHVLGDGFHVAGWLYKSIPFGEASFTNEDLDALSRLGDMLWYNLQTHRFTSVNGGRLTVGFRPLACNEDRDAIDIILIRASGLKEDFATELRMFVQKNAVIDSTDKRRNHVKKHFVQTKAQ